MRTYTANRQRYGRTVLVTEEHNGRHYEKELRHFERHSPDGFEWGYAGSGPADLALALCADALGAVEPAFEVYQEVKWRLVAMLPHSGWAVQQQSILDIVAEVRESHKEAVV